MGTPRPAIESECLGYNLLRPRNAGPTDMPLLGEADLGSSIGKAQ